MATFDRRCHRLPSLYEVRARKPMPDPMAGLPDSLQDFRGRLPRRRTGAGPAQDPRRAQAARAQSTRVRSAIASFIMRASSIGLRPKNRLNSRLNCDGLS